MKVGLAAQTLSESVANSLQFCQKNSDKEDYGDFKDCDSTINFDILNSKSVMASMVSLLVKLMAVIKRLYETFCDQSPPQKKKILPETADSVIKYYMRDDISRQSPNVKDVVTVYESGENCKIPARHLT